MTEARQRGVMVLQFGSALARKTKSASWSTVARLMSKAQRGRANDTISDEVVRRPWQRVQTAARLLLANPGLSFLPQDSGQQRA